MSDNRPSAYREGDRWVFRASGFAGCVRSLAYAATGVEGEPYPTATREAMDFGTANEHVIIDRLMDEGVWEVLADDELKEYGELDDTGQLKLELRVGRAVIRCHPDGIVENRVTGERRVLEVKCLAESNNRPEQFPNYMWQFSIESAVTKLPVLLVIGWKEPDPANGDMRKLKDGVEVREIQVAYGPGEIKARALRLAKTLDEAMAGVYPTCDREMYPCPWYQLHDRDSAKVQDREPVDSSIAGRVDELIEEVGRLDAMKKDLDLDGKVKAAKAEIAELIGWDKVVTAGAWNIDTKIAHIPESTSTRKAHERKTISWKKVES